MAKSQDTQLALLLSRLEVLEQEKIDKALAIQEMSEKEGTPLPLAAVLVRQGFLPYGVVERVIAHLGDTKLVCKGCQRETGAKAMDPRDPFVCPVCEKPLSMPEADTALTALETIVEGPAVQARESGHIGRVLGGCKLERKVGEGGMGAVYEATQEFLNRRVAVKVLPEYHVHQPGFVERFLRESRSAAQVVHPNVVQVMDAGREGNLYYIIMEFVEGKSLQGILEEEGRLPIHKALDYARQSASGLGAAAELNIIHRDIKPDNVRVNPRGIAKVADFGLAKDVETTTQLTLAGAVVGTPLYMSPEQARGEKVDFRSDIYALGATLYHLIAGEPPFKGNSAITILQKHLSEEPPPLTEVVEECPPEVNTLVSKMMAKKPEDRFASYADLVKNIEEIQGRATTMRETVVRPAVQPVGGKPKWILPVVVLAVVALAVGGFFIVKEMGKGDTDVTGTSGATGPGPTAPTGPVTPPLTKVAGLKVTSEPEGATVFLNDKEKGITPLDLEDLGTGVFTLRVELPDYQTVEREIHLISNKTTEEAITLTRAPALVRIETTPHEGAEVFLDDELQGKTPLDLEAPGAGTYSLRVVYPGYGEVRRSIDLAAGENDTIQVPLDALPATVTIVTVPAGALVTIDGEVAGEAPVTKEGLVAGKHTFEATLKGYELSRWDLELSPGEKTQHDQTLVRLPEIEKYLAGIAEVGTLLDAGFPLRARDRHESLREAKKRVQDELSQEEEAQDRALAMQLFDKAPAMDLAIRFGGDEGTQLRGGPDPGESPERIPGFTGPRGKVAITVRGDPRRPLRMAFIQLGLGEGLKIRVLPSEAMGDPGDGQVPLLEREESLTYRLGNADVYMFLLIALSEPLSLEDLDRAKGEAIDESESDPLKRGLGAYQSFRKFLEASGKDFGLRVIWIDDRTMGG